MSRPITYACALAAAAGALCLAAPAGAEPSGAAPPPNRTVFYGDLNLATDAGARTMLKRIRSAARVVCQAAHRSESGLEADLRLRGCRSDTVAKAVRNLGSERVSRLHNEQGQPTIRTARAGTH